jgi:hypothetical protein
MQNEVLKWNGTNSVWVVLEVLVLGAKFKYCVVKHEAL